MEKMVKALLRSEIKKVGENEYEFIMSDETIDRDGEVIKVDGWDLKNFKKNSILLWGHRHDIPGIGVVGAAVKQDGKLVAKKVRFATEGIYELADTVRGLVDDKVLKAVSVGYIPKKRSSPNQDDDDDKSTKGKKKPRVITEEAELYELSIVNVGSHPDALAVLKSVEQKAENDPPEEWFSETLWRKMFPDDGEEVSEKPYPSEHACRLRDPDDFQKDSFRRYTRKHKGKAYSVIAGRLKGEDSMTEQAFRYKKDVWDAADARAHCKDHDGSFEAASESSIESLIDRLEAKVDQVCEMIKTMVKPKRRYDGLFAGDSKSESDKPTHTLEDKQNPFAEVKPQNQFENSEVKHEEHRTDDRSA